MKTQKILILGITGNLAKLKILPAIGQYYDLHSHEVNIEIYGYSRSKADLEEIQLLIRSQTKFLQNESQLPKLTLIQGEYSDKTFYDELVGSLTVDDSLAVYLAVPPSVYTNFLENSCPYSRRPIDILIEKPFGESMEEGRRILDIVTKCDLHQRVHFLDHYLFKSALQVDAKEIQTELANQNLTFQKVSHVSILALETVDVKERGGYYDQNGAIKDMFPHLFSLYHFMLNILENKSKSIDWQAEVEVEQYSGYKEDVNNLASTTESFFDARLVNKFEDGVSIPLQMNSGKKQVQKLTQVLVDFEEGYQLDFRISPQTYIRLLNKDKALIKEFKINLDDKLDHTRVFENVFAGDFSRFVPNDKVLEYWEVYDKIAAVKKLVVYS
jgi:glucose-6-phosphate 1-dehydrogenase